jgi:hypothetical protein
MFSKIGNTGRKIYKVGKFLSIDSKNNEFYYVILSFFTSIVLLSVFHPRSSSDDSGSYDQRNWKLSGPSKYSFPALPFQWF